MIRVLVLSLILSIFSYDARAFTCDDVIYARAHFSEQHITALAASATPADKAKAEGCLSNAQPGLPHSTPTVKCSKKDPKCKPPPPSKPEKVAPPPAHSGPTKRIINSPTLPPVKPAPIQSVSNVPNPEDTPMPTFVVPVLAVFGALAFAFCVGKYGLVPVFTKVRGWLNSSGAALSSLEARIKNLETEVFPAKAAAVTAPAVVHPTAPVVQTPAPTPAPAVATPPTPEAAVAVKAGS